MHLIYKTKCMFKKKNHSILTLSKYAKEIFEKNVIVTLGSKRGGMVTCIVICLITVQANIYTYFKPRMSFF